MTAEAMRTLVFDGPAPDRSRTRVARMPVPKVGAGQVLIEVDCAGINFKDIMMRRGDPGYADAWPVVPGLEVSGTVASLGDGVDALAVGERVTALTGTGGLAEYALAEAALTVPVPAGVGLEAAAVVPGVLATAELLVRESARVRAGDVIAVHSAAGGVGQAVAQVARAIGQVTLIGLVGSESRIEAALAAGYDAAFVRGPELADQVRTGLGDRTVDLVLDPQGTDWIETDLALLAPAGRVVLFGNAAGHPLGALPPTGQLYGRNASIGGFSITAMSAEAPGLVAAAMRRALADLADGAIESRPTVADGLSAAPVLHESLAQGTGTGKHVVKVAA